MRTFAIAFVSTICLAVTGWTQEPPVPPSTPIGLGPTLRSSGRFPPPGEPLLRSWVLTNGDASCRHPAPASATEERTIFLELSFADTGRHIPIEYLSLLALDLSQSIRLVTPLPDGRLELASAEGKIPPSALLTSATLVFRGDGTVGDLAFRPGADARLAQPLRVAFDALVERGGLGAMPDVEQTLEIPLLLSFASSATRARGQAPIFRLGVPRERGAMLLPGMRPPDYPLAARDRGGEAYLILTYVVDEEGRPVPETIESVPPKEELTPEAASVFRIFESAAIAKATEYRYQPAEILGCRLRMGVQQGFEFRLIPR